MIVGIMKVAEALASDLLSWYGKRKRSLPWRETRDPYQIWVSEIMLQQTRVDTVIPYFERFMEKFPTLHHLAAAEEAEVLKAWEGLGYYSRARNLHQAVKEVEERYGGVVPDEEEELIRLPGIGPYTSGAILSIAYGKKIPAIDGNVLRVASRLFAITEDVGRESTRRKIKELLLTIIPEEAPDEFNQALMEIGALVCLPKAPACEECPVRRYCEGKKKGIESSLPRRKKVEKVKVEQRLTLLLHSPKGVLMRKRKESLLHGMWEFPNWLLKKGENPLPFLEKELSLLGIPLHEIPRPMGEVHHVFSHMIWQLSVFLLTLEERDAAREDKLGDYCWVSKERYHELPVPIPFQRVYQLNDR
ncbi:putative A/G-specific adenine glycosylase YfhQ [[Clostridium] ultunense Esp]|nr:putative A/G-specific adenine glycosylase YfhQ [[Clostridium] ultunense Esp]